MTDELDKIIRQALRPLELGDIFNLTEEEIEQKRVQAIQALIADQMAEYQAQLLKDYKEDIATAVREARIDERSQAQQYLHGLTITPESQHLFAVLSRNNYDRIKEIKRSKE